MSRPEPEPSERAGGGPWRAASSGPRWGLRFLDAMFARLPLRGAYLLVIGLAPIWYLHYNRPRHGVIRAMRRIGVRRPWWAGLRAYAAYTLALVDRHYVRAGRIRPTVDSGGLEGLDRAVRAPGPLVFLGSHCGCLEMGVPALETIGRPVRAVAVRDPAADQLLRGVGDAAASVGGRKATIVADGTVSAGLRMLKALRAGEILAFKADRHLPGSAERDRVRVPLFGEEVELPRGPAEIVRLAKAGAVVLSVFRVGPVRYAIEFEPLETAGRSAEAIAEDYARVLERHVRRRPDRWFNFYPYWKRDAEQLAWMPETVPPGLRAGAWTVRGSLAAAVVSAVLGLAVLPSALLAGLQGALAATLMGMSTGATVDRFGRRNPSARASAALGPALTVSFLLVGRGVGLSPLDLLIGAIALAVGAVASNLSRGPRRRGAPA